MWRICRPASFMAFSWEEARAYRATRCSGEIVAKALSVKRAAAEVFCCGHERGIAAERGARLGRVERIIIPACTPLPR